MPFSIFKILILVQKLEFDAVFFTTDQLLYHKFEDILFFWSGNLYSLCSPGLSEKLGLSEKF